ncbi:acyl-CoA carboxylase epsilon subunit [Nonomuraea sp. NPDC050202]|uniref:acyl-CoA carboxylase epsilon subunit n=1 Tax=Nonomuraea sp. NPDC050202 TaxID=3155035 RepID=UPI0033D93664
MKITKGSPTSGELAALVVALHAARQSPAPAPAPAPAWAPVTRRPRRSLRRPVLPGPGGWRESRWTMGGHP